ncbi:MAG: hypothetical protein HUJ72_05585, partial [Blautia sp.]|nr:hypothetical protein [Blautia sp.]
LPLFFLGIIALISFMGIYRQQTEHLSELCQKVKEAGMYAYVLHGGGPEEIILPDVYSFQPVGGVIPIPKVRSINTIKVHAWTGAGEDSFQTDENDEAAQMVYVADNGTVYHTDPECSYIKISIEQISGAAVDYYRNENGEKYSACEICSRHQEPGTCVYITGQGDRYHNSAACSGLKRSGRLVRMEDCGNMGACSRCSGH